MLIARTTAAAGKIAPGVIVHYPVLPVRQAVISNRQGGQVIIRQQVTGSVVAKMRGAVTPTGRRGITSLLNRSASILKRGADAASYPWEQLSFAAVAKVRAALLDDGYAVSSVNMALSALRGIAQTAFNLNCLEADTLARIRAVKRVNGDNQRKGRALSREEVRALVQAAKRHPQRIRCCRDVAIVMALCGAGLRCGELVSLERRGYDKGILTVRQGERRKYREIHVAAAVDKAIRAWITASGAKEAGDALFNRIQRNGRVASQPLTTTGLTGILEQLQQNSGIATYPRLPAMTAVGIR